MRAFLWTAGLLALAFSAPALYAAPALRTVMHQWRGEARAIQGALSSGGADAKLRASLSVYIADAGRIGAAVNGKTARARDFKRRFLAFQSDARTALGHVGQKPMVKADVTRLMAECRACHKAFN